MWPSSCSLFIKALLSVFGVAKFTTLIVSGIAFFGLFCCFQFYLFILHPQNLRKVGILLENYDILKLSCTTGTKKSRKVEQDPLQRTQHLSRPGMFISASSLGMKGVTWYSTSFQSCISISFTGHNTHTRTHRSFN